MRLGVLLAATTIGELLPRREDVLHRLYVGDGSGRDAPAPELRKHPVEPLARAPHLNNRKRAKRDPRRRVKK